MTREKAIKIVKEFINGTCLHSVDQEALETLIPELVESEDERIIRLLREFGSLDVAKELYEEFNLSYTDVLYWLEKQKECVSNNFDDVWDEEDCEEIIAEGQKLTPRFKELLKEVCHAWYDRGAKFEKQKEQKPVEWSEEDEDTINLMIAILRENYSNCLFKTNSANTIRMSAISTDMLIKRIEALRPQPKQEWNDEDERIRKQLIDAIKIGRSNSGISFTEEAASRYIAWLEKHSEEEIRKIRKEEYTNGFNDAAGFGKQKEQIPYTDFVIKSHKGNDNNPYDMRVSEAQEYAINRGFGVPFNDGEVYVDERHMTQTIGNILRWADEHPKEQKPADYDAELKKCKDNPLYFYDKYVSIKQKPAEWSEEHIADIFEKVGLAKIVREQGNDALTNAVQSAMIELSKVENTQWSEEDETALGDLMWCIEQARKSAKDENDMGNIWFAENWVKNRLKSLRPSWKPIEKYAKNKDFSDCLTELACELYECHDESDSPEDTSIKEYHVLEKWEPILLKKAQIWKPSEEDIKMLEHIIGQYETGNKNSKVMGYLPRIEELNFLKKVLAKWKNLL